MRGARGAATVLALACAPLAATAAQPAGRPTVELGAGLAIASPLLRDGNGTRVGLGPAAVGQVVMLRPAWRGAAAPRLVLRTARAAVRLRAPGERWSAGGAWQHDALLGVAVPLPGPLPGGLTAHAAAGASWLVGPRDVAPFDGGRAAPAVEAGLSRAIGARTGAALVVQGRRLAPAQGDAGVVGRVLLLLTHAP